MTRHDSTYGGESWERPDSDKVVARRVLVFLEQKRALYDPHEQENVDYVIESVLDTRKLLTSELGKLGDQSELAKSLRMMLDACREFLSANPAAKSLKSGSPSPESWSRRWAALEKSLPKLRKAFGLAVRDMVIRYQLTVHGPLLSIVPSDPAPH
jgi:hypothetical protein